MDSNLFGKLFWSICYGIGRVLSVQEMLVNKIKIFVMGYFNVVGGVVIK